MPPLAPVTMAILLIVIFLKLEAKVGSCALLQSCGPALQGGPKDQEAAVHVFEKPCDARNTADLRQPSPARQHRPQRQERLCAAHDLAVGPLHMKARQGCIAGQPGRQRDGAIADIGKAKRHVPTRATVERDLPPAQRAGAVIEDGESG